MDCEEWTIAEVLAKVTRSGDSFDLSTPEGWRNMMVCKMGDAHTPAILHEILENGFLDPIYIHNGTLYNGHHRLTLMILLGAETILVTDHSSYNASLSNRVSRAKHHNSEEARWIANQLRESVLVEA